MPKGKGALLVRFIADETSLSSFPVFIDQGKTKRRKKKEFIAKITRYPFARIPNSDNFLLFNPCPPLF